MSSHAHIYPSFDPLELSEAPEIAFTRFERLSPIQAGTVVVGFGKSRNRRHHFFDEVIFSAQAFSYARKPLLLYFYEYDWGIASRDHLKQLNAIQGEFPYKQINILVITARSLSQFRALSKAEGLHLEVYEDSNNELAGLLGLFAKQSPAWSRYTGIERNVALPGLYLLDQNRQVVFAYPNQNIHQEFPIEALTCVCTVHQINKRESA